MDAGDQGEEGRAEGRRYPAIRPHQLVLMAHSKWEPLLQNVKHRGPFGLFFAQMLRCHANVIWRCLDHESKGKTLHDND